VSIAKKSSELDLAFEGPLYAFPGFAAVAAGVWSGNGDLGWIVFAIGSLLVFLLEISIAKSDKEKFGGQASGGAFGRAGCASMIPIGCIAIAIGAKLGTAWGWASFLAFAGVSAIVVWVSSSDGVPGSTAKARSSSSSLGTRGQIDGMTGEEFEHFLGGRFRQLGYATRVTQLSGDYGADLLLDRDGRKTVVQAKRWRARVGIEAIQQVHAARGYYGARAAMVVSSSYFTEAAKTLARKLNVELIDRTDLMDDILRDADFDEEAVSSVIDLEQDHGDA
jgi:hypothetical protein